MYVPDMKYVIAILSFASAIEPTGRPVASSDSGGLIYLADSSPEKKTVTIIICYKLLIITTVKKSENV